MSKAREMFTHVVCATCGIKVDPFASHSCDIATLGAASASRIADKHFIEGLRRAIKIAEETCKAWNSQTREAIILMLNEEIQAEKNGTSERQRRADEYHAIHGER